MRLFRFAPACLILALSMISALTAHAQDLPSAPRVVSAPTVPAAAAKAAPVVSSAAVKTAPDLHRAALHRAVRHRWKHHRLEHRMMAHRALSPVAGGIGTANAAARIDPDPSFWHNAIQQYAYADGALYQVYAAPGRVTDIALQEGEELAGSGPVAAGDTVRWIIGDTMSGTGKARRIHLLIKPTRSDLVTNLVVNTDRRTYHLELRAQPATYMAALSWTYPQDELIALQNASAEAQKPSPSPPVSMSPPWIFATGSRVTRLPGDRSALLMMGTRRSSNFLRVSRPAICRRSS
jgi:type IV secretion system protein VirB9